MRLAINSGGLDSFFNGISSFVNMGANSINSNRLIDSFQTVANKTSDINGGVGTLGTALEYIKTCKVAEETRRTAVQAVKTKTDNFIQTALRVDAEVAATVNASKEEFYKTNPWLRPPAPPSNWDKFWGGAADTAKACWKGVKDFYKEHKKVIDTVLIVAGAALAIAAVICTGGLALVPMLATGLTAVGVGAGALTIATTASLIIAGIAVTSTIASSTLNIIDTWGEIDDPTFNKWQKGLNIASIVSNGLYSVGNIYNSIKGVSGKEFIARHKAIENGKVGYSNLDAKHPKMRHKAGAEYTEARKAEIYKENMRRNNGVLRSDKTGKILEEPLQSTKGVKPPANEAQTDHIVPKSLGGNNSFSNAQLIERVVNRVKGANANFSDYLKYSVADKGSILKALGFGLLNPINSVENIRFAEVRLNKKMFKD